MPAWAKCLPKEVLGCDKLGFVLFPTQSTPRGPGRAPSGPVTSGRSGSLVSGKTGDKGPIYKRRGINRPGHPVLKLADCEKESV